MVDVRVVRVLVGQHLVTMRVCMRFGGFLELMLMLVMFIVDMSMGMLEGLVGVLVQVSLTHVQPDAQRHQGCGHPEPWAWHAGPDAQ